MTQLETPLDENSDVWIFSFFSIVPQCVHYGPRLATLGKVQEINELLGHDLDRSHSCGLIENGDVLLAFAWFFNPALAVICCLNHPRLVDVPDFVLRYDAALG